MRPERGSDADRPAVLICGTVHLTDRGDWRSFDFGDVRAGRRAEEVADLAARLGAFAPTAVAVEVETRVQSTLTQRYDAFRAGAQAAGDSEVEQIAFRVARAAGLPRVHAIDWMGTLPGQKAYGEVMEWAQAHQPALYRALSERPGLTPVVETDPLLDIYRAVNNTMYDALTEQHYLRLAEVGQGDAYVGLDWLQWWYRRNLILFVNITRLAASSGDRVFVLIGAGHRYILHQFLRGARRFTLHETEEYLG